MKRILSLALSAALMLSLISCAKSGETSSPPTKGDKNNTAQPSVSAVGAWVEQEVTPTDGKRAYKSPYLLEDSTLWYFTQEVENGSPVQGKSIVRHVSTDNGVTWKSEEITWTQTTGGDIPLGFDVSKNGTVIFQSIRGQDEPFRLWLCKKDGTPEELFLEGFDASNGASQMLFLNESTVLLVSSGRLDESGKLAPTKTAIFDLTTKKKISDVTQNETSENIFCPVSYDGKLYFANYSNDGAVTLNEILPDGSVNENLAKLPDFNYGSASVDADGNYYFLTKTGISRIAKGGSVTEGIVEGGAFAITSPENYVAGISLAADGSIIASILPAANNNEDSNKITKNTLYRYYYDEKLPAPIVSDALRVWSLHDNLTVRGAIVHFAKAMPELAVDLEIALADGDILPQDALRNLNTELLSGQGPDVIIFDDADYEQYIKKNVLEDLAPVLKDIPFAENLIAPFYQDDKAFVVPARFAVPIIFGAKDDISSLTSLFALQDKILSLPKRPDANVNDDEYYKPLDEKDKYAFSFKSITELTDFVLQTSMPAIISNNKIDETALREAYGFIKAVSDYNNLANYRAEQSDNGIEISDDNGNGLMLADGSLEYSQTNRAKFGREIMYIPAAYPSVLSNHDAQKHIMTAQPGLVSGAYLPKSLIGVNANSGKKQAALEFVKVVFGSDIQNTFYGYDKFRGDGMTVLSPAITALLESSFKKDGYEAFRAQTNTIFDALKTPVIISETVREKLLAHSTALCIGEEDIDRAISGTIQDLELYLAERE